MSEKKFLTIQPSNVPATGKVSHARGNPILTVVLGRQDAQLDLDSIRLSADFNIWRNAAGTLHPTAGAAAECMASHKLGAFGIIDQLVFRQAETKQVLEHIRHYGRFMSSFLPVMSGYQDQAGHLSESALIMPNYQAFRDAVIRNTAKSSFSIPLPAGMTLGADKLPLSKVPLEIEIHLAPDSQFFYSSDGVTTNISECFYELSNIELTCEVDVGDESPDQGVWSFNSITSYYSTLESTNSIINYSLGLSKVLGAFVNFVPSSFVNNLAQDGFLTYMPSLATGALANLETIAFLRNGERFPKNFEVKSIYDGTTNVTTVVDSQVIKSFLHSIIPESQHNRTGAGPLVSNRNFLVSGTPASKTNYRYIPECGAVYGVGVLYDMLDSEGVDFTNAQFSIQMTNGLTDGNPISAYLFIKSKVVVAYDAGMGVQILQ